MGLPNWMPRSSLRFGAFAVGAARISTNGSNRSLGVQSGMSQKAPNVLAEMRAGVAVTNS
ncbi:hypothetical protein J2Y68_000595 [Paenarthrobacter nitroguajacolicus]|nr:hypothetical protein [Paenarthrobacter nitroguajacolicus]